MPNFDLIPHPDFPSVAVHAIRVTADRRDSELILWFWLTGDLNLLSVPGPCADCVRADGLWKHTCFEAFIRADGMPGYNEFNYSPSGRWAAYGFDRYREGMRNLESPTGIPIVGVGYRGSNDESHGWEFVVDIFGGDTDWSLGLSAVIEAKDGTKSYWALAHPPGKPDFHNADCFTARLAAPAAS
jgi:hypothetical protein